jgi:lysozyme
MMPAAMKRNLPSLLVVSAACVASIAGYEGFSSMPYRDAAGVQTVGFGHAQNVAKDSTVTRDSAKEILRRDMNATANALIACVKVPLAKNEYDAYLSLAYTVGSAACCESTLVRKLNAGDYAGACADIDEFVWVKNRLHRAGEKLPPEEKLARRRGKLWVYRKLPGLVKRRKEERALCEGKTHVE